MTLEYTYAENTNPIKEITLKRLERKDITLKRTNKYSGEVRGIQFIRPGDSALDLYFLTDSEVDEFIKALQDIKEWGVL